jgi:hypothetical protein
VTNCNLTAPARLKSLGRSAIFRHALVSLSLLLSLPLVAQVSGGTSPAVQTHLGQRRTSIAIDDRVKVLAKNLDLNDEQQSAVRKILEQRQQETLRIRLNRSISGDARFERFRALQDNTVLRIRAILSEEQRKKYDPLAVRRLPSEPQQRSVEDWLKVTTPH